MRQSQVLLEVETPVKIELLLKILVTSKLKRYLDIFLFNFFSLVQRTSMGRIIVTKTLLDLLLQITITSKTILYSKSLIHTARENLVQSFLSKSVN